MQQNVALVQQSGAAVDALNRQARNLLGAVNLFSVGSERGSELKSPNPQQRDATARNPALSLASSYSRARGGITRFSIQSKSSALQARGHRYVSVGCKGVFRSRLMSVRCRFFHRVLTWRVRVGQ
ncbi:hypothetical protein [Paraburkholderia sp. 32]|uniref:hypothetical protein n=2 Tax=unclassified Paraburkholderia TaxID=2615204 RepID=UPI003D24B8D0